MNLEGLKRLEALRIFKLEGGAEDKYSEDRRRGRNTERMIESVVQKHSQLHKFHPNTNKSKLQKSGALPKLRQICPNFIGL
jgi:hypothetical protein